MSDLEPFEHGEEGTHGACWNHMVEMGDKVTCCECNKRTDCGSDK